MELARQESNPDQYIQGNQDEKVGEDYDQDVRNLTDAQMQ